MPPCGQEAGASEARDPALLSWGDYLAVQDPHPLSKKESELVAWLLNC